MSRSNAFPARELDRELEDTAPEFLTEAELEVTVDRTVD
jgi:hypothetical protein